MIFNLSIVNIVPESDVENINLLGSVYYIGSGNLSVKLSDNSGNIFYGCHSWWSKEHYFQFTDNTIRNKFLSSREFLTQRQIDDINLSISNLYERIVLDGVSKENWNAALIELGLFEL